MLKVLRPGLFLSSTLVLVGCSGTQSPALSVAGAQLKEHTDSAAVIEFAINAENPNDEPLPLQDVEYSVSRDGKEIFSGTRSAEAVVKRFGQQQFLLPAAFATNQPDVSGEYTISGTLWYVAPGALSETLFDQAIVRPTVSFSGKAAVK
jgi:hypothetical protein